MCLDFVVVSQRAPRASGLKISVSSARQSAGLRSSGQQLVDCLGGRVGELDHTAVGFERFGRVKPDGAEVGVEQVAAANLFIDDLGAAGVGLADHVARP